MKSLVVRWDRKGGWRAARVPAPVAVISRGKGARLRLCKQLPVSCLEAAPRAPHPRRNSIEAVLPWSLRGSGVPALPAPSECMADVWGLATPCGSRRVVSLSQPLALAGAAGSSRGQQPPPPWWPGRLCSEPAACRPGWYAGARLEPRPEGGSGDCGGAGSVSLATSVGGMEDSLPCLAAACDPSALVNFCTGNVPPPRCAADCTACPAGLPGSDLPLLSFSSSPSLPGKNGNLSSKYRGQYLPLWLS